MSGELENLRELEKRHKESPMKHWTEALPDLPPNVQFKGMFYKQMVTEFNRQVDAMALWSEQINKYAMSIDRAVDMTGLYSNDQIEKAIETDTCHLKELEL